MRNLIRAVCIAALLMAAAPARAGAAEGRPIVMLERAVLAGDTVTLRDVAAVPAELPPEVQNLPLGNAPWPGHARKVTRSLVAIRLLSAGFEPGSFPLTGAQACIVERATVRVEPAQLAAAARDHLRAQFPQEGPEVHVELLNEAGPVLVPWAEEPLELRPSVLGSAAPMGIVRVDVDVVRGGVRLCKVPLSFAVKVHDRVAVAARSIGAGERFTRANVSFAQRDIAAVDGGCVRALEELEGKVAARPLRPGQPITRRAVAEAERPFVIGLNQRVYLVLETPTLRAVTMGRSLCRARQGEPARAENLSTGREVVGVAAADSTIRVMMEGQLDGQ